MKKNKKKNLNNNDLKVKVLKEKGCLNKNAEKVIDELFQNYDFFDPNDLIQVKYEMIRRVRKDGWTVSRAAKTFGFSRPSFYELQDAFEKSGLFGFIPLLRGPKSPHKLSDEVMNYVEEVIAKDESIKAPDLSKLIKKKFGLKVHPRSIEKACVKRKKNLKLKRQRKK